jgi:hypothetical protein
MQRRANNPGNDHADGHVKPGARQWHRAARSRRTQQQVAEIHRQIAAYRKSLREHVLPPEPPSFRCGELSGNSLTIFSLYGIITPTTDQTKAMMETSKPTWSGSEPGIGESRGSTSKLKILPEPQSES